MTNDVKGVQYTYPLTFIIDHRLYEQKRVSIFFLINVQKEMEYLGIFEVGGEANLHLTGIFQVGSGVITVKVAGSRAESCINTLLIPKIFYFRILSIHGL